MKVAAYSFASFSCIGMQELLFAKNRFLTYVHLSLRFFYYEPLGIYFFSLKLKLVFDENQKSQN